MFGEQAVYPVIFDLATDPTASANFVLFRAPIACTVQRFTAVSNKASGSGTAIALRLVNFGTVGTAIKSAGGTIGTAQLGGTVVNPLGANVPASTASFTNPYIAAGEYIALQLTEEGGGWQSGEVLRVQVDIINAKTADNA
jgi:hypothetical protein